MTMDIKINGCEAVITLAGRLDTVTAPQLDKAISEDIQDAKSLVLDLKEIEYISSAGLRVLLSTQKIMKNQGTMKVKNVCPEIMEVFDITGFLDILTIE